MSWIDRARAKAHGAITRLPGKAGELADRRAFANGKDGAPLTAAGAPKPDPSREVAPVIVYHMDKTRRDALKLVELLEGAGIPHKVSNIQEDPAAQMAVRRDSKGYRLPVVFIAGEPIGGRSELVNMQTSGELKKKVFG
jgi:hypothetical protein